MILFFATATIGFGATSYNNPYRSSIKSVVESCQSTPLATSTTIVHDPRSPRVYPSTAEETYGDIMKDLGYVANGIAATGRTQDSVGDAVSQYQSDCGHYGRPLGTKKRAPL